MATRRIATLCAVLIVLATGLAACGGGSHDDSSGHAAVATGEAAERAFLEGMVPHHTSALAMGEVAERRSQAPVIRRIAADIMRTQTDEIALMEDIHRRRFGSELVPDEGAHAQLGLSAEEAGMDHGDSAASLDDAEPFDRAFVDEMVAHHRGAVAMAEAVLSQTQDAELRRLASTIVTEQRREIRELNDFRTETYGAPAPEPASASLGEDGAGEDDDAR